MGTIRRAWALLAGLPAGLLTDAFVLAYAAWTITANLVVIAAGNAHALAKAAIACAVVLAVALALGLRSARLRAAYLADLADDPQGATYTRIPTGGFLALACAALGLLAWTFTRNPWMSWGGFAAASIALAWAALRPTQPGTPQELPTNTARAAQLEVAVTYVTALVAAAVTLLVVRPRSDGTFYLNIAVSVVDFPEQALLSIKNVHGPANDTLPFQPMFPPYKVHSFELLGGLLSRFTGWSAAHVIHLGLAPLFAWLTPFALRRLLRIVAPRDVALALCVILSFYCIEGSAARGYANHALVRMFDGKSALLTMLLPLICAYGLRFGARPTWFRFTLLALAQIAGLGLSSTGLWLVPTVAMVAVLAGTPSPRAWLARAAGSVASSAYVLAAGLWILGQMHVGSGEPAEVDAVAEGMASTAQQGLRALPSEFRFIAESFSIVLGPSHTTIALLGIAFVGTVLAPTTLALRLLAALICVLVLGFVDPWLVKTVAHRVTGAVTYHRVFWLLPVPLMLALATAGVARRLQRRFEARLVWPLTAAALLAFYVGAVDRLVVSRDNEASVVFPPALKLPPVALAAARELCKWAPAGTHVLAPLGISQQLPTLHRCAAPLIAGERWMTAAITERQIRLRMQHIIDKGGDVPIEQASWYASELDRHGLDVVWLAKESARNPRIKSLLRIKGFERVAAYDWHQIYRRARPTSLAQAELVARRACKVAAGGTIVAPFGVAQALAAQRCASNLMAPSAVLARPAAELDELMRIERLTFVGTDLPSSQIPWLRSALERHSVSVVVIGPAAAANKNVRLTLGNLGMARVALLHGHSVFAATEGP